MGGEFSFCGLRGNRILAQGSSLTLRRILPIVGMMVILLIAFAVRFHQLGEQSLWYDEGVAYGHSQRTLDVMIPMLQNNVHVPAYFGSLAYWEDLVGSTEFGLRSWSALLSVLSVAFAYAVGKRAFGVSAGLASALFVALNTFSIYYAQETRMYAMLAMVASASMWIFIGFFQSTQRPPSHVKWYQSYVARYGFALAVVNSIGMYTHFSYALVMLAQGFMAVLWLLAMFREGLRDNQWRLPFMILGAYTVFNLITVIAFSPWLSIALSQSSAQPNISDIVPLDQLARTFQGWLALGITYEENLGGMGIVFYFFALFGLIQLPDQRKRAWWFLLLPVAWVMISLALYTALGLYERYLRFLIPAQIGMALWMGRGVWVLWHIRTREQSSPLRYLPKFAAVFATLAFAFTLAQSLDAFYNDPEYQRDDYRGLVAQIEDNLRADDAIILSAAGVQEIFGYYYTGDAPIYPLPVDKTTMQADTQAIIDEHDVIYAVFYGNAEQDPDLIIERTLNEGAFPISDVWVDDVRLARFVAPAEFDTPTAQNIAFGDAITLTEADSHTDTFQAGDVVQIRLVWETSEQLDVRYKVFVQLLNGSGALVAQRDSEPVGGLGLTVNWEDNTPIVDLHALALPSDLPSGDYTIIIGLYDINNPSMRLPVGDSDFWELGQIQME